MPPFMGGGEMIQDVFLDHSTYAEPPSRFEAGTPAIAEAIGLGAACDYLNDVGMDKLHAYEEELGGYLYDQVRSVARLVYVEVDLTKPCWGRWLGISICLSQTPSSCMAHALRQMQCCHTFSACSLCFEMYDVLLHLRSLARVRPSRPSITMLLCCTLSLL